MGLKSFLQLPQGKSVALIGIEHWVSCSEELFLIRKMYNEYSTETKPCQCKMHRHYFYAFSKNHKVDYDSLLPSSALNLITNQLHRFLWLCFWVIYTLFWINMPNFAKFWVQVSLGYLNSAMLSPAYRLWLKLAWKILLQGFYILLSSNQTINKGQPINRAWPGRHFCLDIFSETETNLLLLPQPTKMERRTWKVLHVTVLLLLPVWRLITKLGPTTEGGRSLELISTHGGNSRGAKQSNWLWLHWESSNK